MRKIYLLLLLFLCLAGLSLQAAITEKSPYPGGRCRLYRLYLSDKCGQALSRPERFLSQRSLRRRERQQIALDSTDLPVAQRYIEAVEALGIPVVSKSKWNNTLLVRITSDRQLRKLQTCKFIRSRMKVFTSPDSITTTRRSTVSQSLDEWTRHDNEAYGEAADQIDNVNGRHLHSAGFRGRGMMIAILDAGYMNADKIPSLKNISFAGTRDFVYPESKNIYQEMDHGTKVLSAMAIYQPLYYIGTAPDATYLLLRSEDKNTESRAEEDYWAAAAEYADSMGVDVINSSLGYHEYDDKTSNYGYADQDGERAMISHTASMLAGKGIILVNSAGNDGMGAWKKINFPADARDIITVGSISPDGLNAPFSSVGPTADGRIKPDVMAYGSPAAVVTGRGAIIHDMGTSFSCPIVAGMVACLWQALPTLSAKQIMGLVRQSGDRYATPDNIYGYGVPDFWKAYLEGKVLADDGR